MKKNKELELNLDVEKFVEHYAITEEVTNDEIRKYIKRHLEGCDDEIYYNFTADEVFKEYIDEIRNHPYKLNALDIFNKVTNAEGGGYSYNEYKWERAIPVIRKILEEHYGN